MENQFSTTTQQKPDGVLEIFRLAAATIQGLATQAMAYAAANDFEDEEEQE